MQVLGDVAVTYPDWQAEAEETPSLVPSGRE